MTKYYGGRSKLEPHGYTVDSPAITIESGQTFEHLSMGFVRYNADLRLLLLSHTTGTGSALEEALWPNGNREGTSNLLIALPLYRVPIEGMIEGLVISTNEEDKTYFPAVTNLSKKT